MREIKQKTYTQEQMEKEFGDRFMKGDFYTKQQVLELVGEDKNMEDGKNHFHPESNAPYKYGYNQRGKEIRDKLNS